MLDLHENELFSMKIGLKGGHLDYSHLTELKKIYLSLKFIRKTIQIISN